MKVQEMVNNFNKDLVDGDEPITFSEMCVQMRAKGITLSHADTARGYIEDANKRLEYLETRDARLVWTEDEIAKIKQSYSEDKAFWVKELNKCKPTAIEYAETYILFRDGVQKRFIKGKDGW